MRFRRIIEAGDVRGRLRLRQTQSCDAGQSERRHESDDRLAAEPPVFVSEQPEFMISRAANYFGAVRGLAAGASIAP